MGSKAADDLRQELDKVRQSLRDTDENIRKLTGRESLVENRFRPRDNIGGPLAKRQNIGAMGNWVGVGRRVVGGRFQGGTYAAPDSGDEDELLHKPAVQSSVIATPKDAQSRQDTIEKQSGNEKDKARNRRMFGVLMGTLQQFKVEEKQKEQQELKRKAVEQKLEEKQKAEKETLKKEKQQLFVDRREKQMKLKLLENKIELVQLHEEWEAQTRTLMNFIRCESKPHLFYMPKSHIEASLKKHEQSKAALEAIISERRRQLEEEINEGAGNETQDRNEEKRHKEGPNHDKASRRNHGRAEDGERMDVSDLEDDTGVNIDYGASGDEETRAPSKELHKKSEKPLENKRQKFSRHSRDAVHHSRDERRHDKDEGRSRHGRRHSSKRSERKSVNVEEIRKASEELPNRPNEKERVEDMEVNEEASKNEDVSVQEDEAQKSCDLDNIPCPTSEPKDANVDDDVYNHSSPQPQL